MRLVHDDKRNWRRRRITIAALATVVGLLLLYIVLNDTGVIHQSVSLLPGLRRPLRVRIADRFTVDWFTRSEWQHRPAWSRDGSNLALIYRDERGLRFGVVSADALFRHGTSNATFLSAEGSSIGGVSWHPDGKRLVADFSQGDGWRIQEYDLTTGSHPRTLPLPSVSGVPDYSPDGTRIVFAAKPPSEARSFTNLHLRLYDFHTRQESVLVASPDWEALDPKWCPDGRRIAYQRATTASGEIRVFAVNTGEDLPARAASPHSHWTQLGSTWSGGGRYLAFMEFDLGEGRSYDGGHLIIVDTKTGRWVDLKRQRDGAFIRGQLAWRPGTNQILCRVDDGLAVLSLTFP